MGTASGILRILHAPTAKLIHSWNLPCPENKSSSILKILHVEEKSCVLITTHSDEIWSLCDRLVHKTGLAVQQKILIDDFSVYDLVKVNLPDGGLEVWGTMDNNTLVLLESDGDKWKWSHHKLKPVAHMKFCSHVVCCSFVSTEGREERQLRTKLHGVLSWTRGVVVHGTPNLQATIWIQIIHRKVIYQYLLLDSKTYEPVDHTATISHLSEL